MWKLFLFVILFLFSGCVKNDVSKENIKPKKTIQKVVQQNIAQPYEVTKNCCMVSNEPIEKIKDTLYKKAKANATEEIYGSVVNSNLELYNGRITNDLIKTKIAGLVRVKGNPTYYYGDAFGKYCIKLKAYVTKNDLDRYKLKKVYIHHFCKNNPDLSIRRLKKEAKKDAYISLIHKQKPNLNISYQDAKSLLYDVEITNENLDIDAEVFCFDISAKILPAEVENFKSIKHQPVYTQPVNRPTYNNQTPSNKTYNINKQNNQQNITPTNNIYMPQKANVNRKTIRKIKNYIKRNQKFLPKNPKKREQVIKRKIKNYLKRHKRLP